ncbi:MAG: ACT domain-containing protein [Alphaproteobacteria bacterium]|nr:MAG: ACT domain-containing protein [Alphaproteobacteria bacterium]
MALTLIEHPGTLAVVRLDPADGWPSWLPPTGFLCVVRAEREVSIVVDAGVVPAGLKAEAGWLRFEFQGPFAFEATGILASVAVPLAAAGVGIFALSTFDTDHVLIKAEHRAAALAALEAAGHHVVPSPA